MENVWLCKFGAAFKFDGGNRLKKHIFSKNSLSVNLCNTLLLKTKKKIVDSIFFFVLFSWYACTVRIFVFLVRFTKLRWDSGTLIFSRPLLLRWFTENVFVMYYTMCGRHEPTRWEVKGRTRCAQCHRKPIKSKVIMDQGRLREMDVGTSLCKIMPISKVRQVRGCLKKQRKKQWW